MKLTVNYLCFIIMCKIILQTLFQLCGLPRRFSFFLTSPSTKLISTHCNAPYGHSRSTAIFRAVRRCGETPALHRSTSPPAVTHEKSSMANSWFVDSSSHPVDPRCLPVLRNTPHIYRQRSRFVGVFAVPRPPTSCLCRRHSPLRASSARQPPPPPPHPRTQHTRTRQLSTIVEYIYSRVDYHE